MCSDRVSSAVGGAVTSAASSAANRVSGSAETPSTTCAHAAGEACLSTLSSVSCGKQRELWLREQRRLERVLVEEIMEMQRGWNDSLSMQLEVLAAQGEMEAGRKYRPRV